MGIKVMVFGSMAGNSEAFDKNSGWTLPRGPL